MTTYRTANMRGLATAATGQPFVIDTPLGKMRTMRADIAELIADTRAGKGVVQRQQTKNPAHARALTRAAAAIAAADAVLNRPRAPLTLSERVARAISLGNQAEAKLRSAANPAPKCALVWVPRG